jgi:hypothetical protein
LPFFGERKRRDQRLGYVGGPRRLTEVSFPAESRLASRMEPSMVPAQYSAESRLEQSAAADTQRVRKSGETEAPVYVVAGTDRLRSYLDCF